MQVSFFSHQTVQITMPWGTVAVQKGKECHSLIEDIEIPAADSALGARFQNSYKMSHVKFFTPDKNVLMMKTPQKGILLCTKIQFWNFCTKKY